MANKINSRILLKTGTCSDWEIASTNSNFTPMRGEVCIYTDAFPVYQEGVLSHYIPGIKIGNGETEIEALHFVNNGVISNSKIDELFASPSQFYLDGNTYNFVEGETWQDFVNRNQYPGEFNIFSGKIMNESYYIRLLDDSIGGGIGGGSVDFSDFEDADNLIIPDANYVSQPYYG